MEHVFWTIRYPQTYIYRSRSWRRAWYSPHCQYSRREAIRLYLDDYKHGIWAGKTWRWHKRRHGVSVVKVKFIEV